MWANDDPGNVLTGKLCGRDLASGAEIFLVKACMTGQNAPRVYASCLLYSLMGSAHEYVAIDTAPFSASWHMDFSWRGAPHHLQLRDLCS